MDNPSQAYPHDCPPQENISHVHLLITLPFQEKLISIRELKKEDIETVRVLHQEWFPIQYQDNFYENIDFNKVQGVVALYDGHIVGSLIYRNYTFFLFKKIKYIMTFGVIKELRGFQIGQRMIRSLQGRLELHVIEYNHKAINFYKREGFEVLETIQNYYEIMGQSYSGLYLIKKGKKSLWDWLF